MQTKEPDGVHRNGFAKNFITACHVYTGSMPLHIGIWQNIQRRFFVRLIRRRQTVIESWRHVRQLSCVLVRERFLTRRRGREADPSADQRRSADLIRILQAKFL